MHYVRCPSCESLLSGALHYFHLRLCPHCTAALPRDRTVVAIAQRHAGRAVPPDQAARAESSSSTMGMSSCSSPTLDRGHLELTLAADLLGQVSRRADDCAARLRALERQRDVDGLEPLGSRVERLERFHAEAVLLRSKLKRLHVVTTLLRAYVQLRRRQLPQLSATAEVDPSMMEVH